MRNPTAFIFLFFIISCNLSLFAQHKSDSLAVDSLIKKGKTIGTDNAGEALRLFQQALEITDRSGLVTQKAELYLKMATIFNNRSESEKALSFTNKALVIFRKTNNHKGIGACYSFIGTNYYHQGKNENALQWFQLAEMEYKQSGDKFAIGWSANLLGGVYQQLNQFDKAKNYFTIYLDAVTEMKDTNHIANAFCNLGTIESGKGNQSLAIHYWEKSIALSKKIKAHDSNAAAVYNMLGSAYSDNGEYVKSIELQKEAISLLKLNENKRDLIDSYNLLAFSYEGLKNYKEAYQYILKSDSVQALVTTEQNNKITAEMLAKYETEKKQHDIDLLQVQQEKQKKQNQYAYLGLGLSVITLGGVGFALRSNRKYTNLLKKEDAQKALLLKEIHHRINNNLQIISSLLSMEVKNSDDEKMKTVMAESQNRIRSLSLLHKNLYTGGKPDKIKIGDYLSQLISFYVNAFEATNQDIKIEVDCSSPIELSSRKAVPVGLIVNELVTNAYKYAFPPDYENGKISITVHDNDDETLTLKVSDNGPGGPADKTSGFGTKLIKALSNQLNAVVQAETTNGRSYSITFKV